MTRIVNGIYLEGRKLIFEDPDNTFVLWKDIGYEPGSPLAIFGKNEPSKVEVVLSDFVAEALIKRLGELE